MITAKDITNYLKEKLIGTEFKWDFDYTILETVREYLRSQKVSENIIQNISCQTSSYARQTLYLTYKRQNIGRIICTKAKGKKHYSWLNSSYCDWTFKDIDLVLYKENLSLVLNEATKTVKKIQDHEEYVKNTAKEIFTELTKTYSAEVVKEVANYISKHSYPF